MDLFLEVFMFFKYFYNMGESIFSVRLDLVYYIYIFIFNYLYLFILFFVCLKLILFVVFFGELG